MINLHMGFGKLISDNVFTGIHPVFFVVCVIDFFTVRDIFNTQACERTICFQLHKVRKSNGVFVPVGIDCLIHEFIGQAYLQFTFHQNYAVVIYTPTITYFVIAYRINHYSLQVYPPSCFSQNHRETIYILLGRSIHDFDGMMRHPKNVGNKACRRHPPNRMRNKVANAFHG
jgi:hypothetical protein